MSEIVFDDLNAKPSAPAANEASFYFKDNEPKYQLSDGIELGFGSAFGLDHFEDQKNVTETTTSTIFQTYLSVNYNGLTSGAKYRVAVRWVWGYGSGSNDYRGRLLINSSQVGEELRMEPKDAGNDQRIHSNMWFYLEVPSDLNTSANTIEYQYASSSNGNQARTYACYFEFWRIS